MRAPHSETVGAFALDEKFTETDPWLRAMRASRLYFVVPRSGRHICELFVLLSVLDDEVDYPPQTFRVSHVGNRPHRGERVKAHDVCFSPSYIIDIHHCDPQF